MGNIHISKVASGTILWSDADGYLVAQGANIILFDLQDRVSAKFNLPVPFADRLKMSVAPLSRLLRKASHRATRFGKNHYIVCLNGCFASLDRRDGSVKMGDPLQGSRPLTLRSNGTEIWYGEYRSNPERSEIKILASKDGLSWVVKTTMKGIRHIHAIEQDPFSNGIWIATGDNDDECAIWYTDDDFKTIVPIVSGSQQVRAIGMLFTPDSVLFGTDTPLEQNWIKRIDRKSARIDDLHPVENSVFYASQIESGLFFSTAVEPSDVNSGKDCVLYGSSNGEDWHEVVRRKKDTLPMKLFQYGQIILPPASSSALHLMFSTFGCGKSHNVYRVTESDYS